MHRITRYRMISREPFLAKIRKCTRGITKHKEGSQQSEPAEQKRTCCTYSIEWYKTLALKTDSFNNVSGRKMVQAVWE